ncbi:MAG: S49 family peptidase [Hyphomicrobiaceae bacterium]
MWPFSRTPFVPVLRLSGVIAASGSPLSGNTLSMAGLAGPLERAFSASKLPSVAVIVNSPGGSPVQSHLIFRRIRALAAEKKKRVYVFCEDLAASGGYFIAMAGDEIYADPSSIVGSIGVISSGFGFDKALEKLGVDRRVYTAGLSKSTLDPFLPEKAEDVERIKALQRDVHDVFIGVVKERRGSLLKGADSELFSGAFWSGPRALDHGLIDGISDVRSKMRELHGNKVTLRVIPLGATGLLARLRKLPAFDTTGHGMGLIDPEQAISAIEARLLWSRYGL